MGAVSKMIATVVTYPLQVVQARSRVSMRIYFIVALFCIRSYNKLPGISNNTVRLFYVHLQAGRGDRKGAGLVGLVKALQKLAR